MKKILLAIVAAFMVAGVASAQKLMTIALNNGDTITVKTSKIKDITFQEIPPFYVGTWKVKSIVDNKTTYWEYVDINWDGFPEYYPGDTFEFTTDGKLKTNLGSTLANYFYEESNYVVDTTLPDDKKTLHITYTSSTVPTVLSLDNVNRNFSDKDKSEDKQAFLGVLPNEDDDELLNIYIMDYKSTTFGNPLFYTYACYYDTKPMATQSGMPIVVTLERVK
ncbi:MAG: hypothetical protein J5663_09040 [Bacteroidaceae bacterium]|nr:hypothetical protein [Bacteroidaceae bacterium]